MLFYSRGDRVSTLAITKGENTVLSTRKISVEEAEKTQVIFLLHLIFF
jgi:hypothetical protein